MTVPGSEAIAAADDPLAPIAKELFRPLGVDGVYGRTALYEGMIERLAAFITRQRDPRAEVLRFPPVMSRRQLEKSGYLKSFPNLLGCVCALHGSESAIRSAADLHESGGDWTSGLAASDLVLSPAACYPLYPLVASRGRLPEGGLIFDVAADCFRREPSRSLDRLQTFRMREYVRIGTPEEITSFREGWMQRARGLADQLALPYTVDVANDPFFGRVGQIMAVSQLQQSLKFELLIPYHRTAKPTACMSFNYHREHFGQVWGIQDGRNELAHTGCVAFGMDRLAVALFANHGVDLARWPASARTALGL
ncbi:MAG TPA: amino acid--[acyl-carrier-protein] ligase [Steroidobacteraceae bacterium]|nr:amino acid--[acyl-carrier-protein] ligase [Steroidobacteraceae bacterium]